MGYATQQGVPAPRLLVPLSGVIALAGALSVLLPADRSLRLRPPEPRRPSQRGWGGPGVSRHRW